MTTSRITFNSLATILIILAFSVMAQAQATRTWVSGVGDDVNPCSRTAPCKTFAGAISKTFIGGEIDVLDPGGFGTLSITKSILVDGGNFTGSILATGVNGININIAVSGNDPQRRVTLRRLSINGTGASGTVGTSTGIKGISATTNAFAQLTVENSYIHNFTTAGIDVTTSAAAGARVSIKDTVINNTVIGVQLAATTGFVTGALDKVRIDNCTNGAIAKQNAFYTIRDSFIQGCSTNGISYGAGVTAGGFNLESTVLFSVGVGVAGGAAGTRVDLSNSSILNNTTGISNAGGTLNSHGNNVIAGNASAGVVPTGVGQQ